MPSLNNIISSCKTIKKSKNIYRHSEVISAYLRLSLKKTFLTKKKQKSLSGSYNMFGFKVNYITFNTFFMLYDEIFVAAEYYFKSDKKQPFIIDCGSNIGMSILFYKFIYPDAEIIGFEPDMHAHKTLSKNINDNHLSNTLVYQKALADKEGTIEFFYDSENISSLQMSIMKERVSQSKVEVECTTLSKYITKTVDFLKLDIEGAETLVIQNLHEEGKLKFIEEMVIEYHHHINKDEDNLSEILSLLEKNDFGYQINTNIDTPYKSSFMQDIMIYAYKK